ncbi:amidohydrolase [Clostridium tyrobutyricum]|jgi:amidohydrolase|uniref:N-acetyl-L,L-diaminopimelate deacetylase n=1 Tax=Clostridium tyrobutyricum DIVETGP TaxID=1408889 RepID=W6N1T4_CLOTY|nr:M20 family metallopeptidase [Clostridium tyrobutyricum]AND84998.1 IAA-like amino acid hydrolase [Clostridium tyrobutyricum]ANP69563.1 peptidase M20 [Clostridium tyrobutyricum]MBR9648480.1 amidohydrolase [Clostridium tyrobutyricum]MBV4414825.1 amidohydrolase [Clostridium tyrobutyricum]MBV4423419.1 amidohydrolase [Clostridium tyrobutyricum]
MNLDFLKMARNMQDELVKVRRDIHMHPELDYELYRTQGKIKDVLDKENIEYVESAGSGICAIIRGNGSKTIGLRADMDALPLQDMKKCDYASKEKGKMHACGHDAHTTILLGVAKILNRIKDQLNGNVKLFFEPAEETSGGAKVMIKEGVLESPHVDRVIGLHVEEGIDVGKIGVRYGVVNAASNPFNIKIKGIGAHGARPHTGIDPIVMGSYVVVALQEIISREIPPTDGALITVGSIHGGTAQNIIPTELTIAGIIRTMKTEHREYVKKRLREVTEGIVKSMRGSCEIEIEESYPCLYNDDTVIKNVVSSASKIIGDENIVDLKNPSMGVESFAYFSMNRPSAFYYLGSRNESRGITNPAHGNLFDIDEECLPIGVAIQCQAVYDFLK